MVAEYQLSDLILNALNGDGCPIVLDEKSKQKIHNLCIEHMYSKNRDEFIKKIEAIVKELVKNKMLTE